MSGSMDAQPTSPADSTAFVPVNLAALRVDTIANFDTYFRPGAGQPFVLYSERNIQFTEEARRRLVESNVDTVYVRTEDLPNYRGYIQDNLADLMAEEALPLDEKSELVYASAGAVVENMLANPQSREGVQRSKDLVKHAVTLMLSDKRVFECLLKVIQPKYHIHTHSVNVVTYSIALAQRAGFTDSASLQEMATGALLHDVGKSKIDAAILESSNALSLKEWEILKKHPQYGHEMLSATGSLGEIALDIVLHHHEKARGGGYPDGLRGDLISPFVRLVTIADVFDALTTERTFQKARSSFSALSLMRKQIAMDLDVDFFRLFVLMMGQPTLV